MVVCLFPLNRASWVGHPPYPSNEMSAERKLRFRSDVGNGTARANARGLGPRAPEAAAEGLLPCGAAMLRVAAPHQFASAYAGFARLTLRP